MGKSGSRARAFRRAGIVSLTTASMVAAGFGAWAADTIFPDGDAGTAGPNINFASTASNGNEPCTAIGTSIDGVITVNYHGASTTNHFAPGEPMTATLAPSTSSITAALGTTAQPSVYPTTIPSDWGSTTTSFTIPIHTTVSTTSTGGHVDVNVHGVNSGYDAGADTSATTDPSSPGKPAYNVVIDTSCSSGGGGQSVNAPPSLAWTSDPATAQEGDTKTYSFSFTDPDSISWSFVTGYPSCGSLGTVSGTPSIDQTNKTGTFDCTFPDGYTNASSTVTAEITDGTDASNQLSQPVAIANVNPTVNSVSVNNPSTVACIGGNSVGLGFTFSDPGVNDNPWTPSINWGDGSTNTTSPSVGVQTSAAPWTVGTSIYSHTYGAGTYTPSMTLTDKDNGQSASVSSSAGSVSLLYSTGSGILQPINADKSSNFKLGSVFPIKIRITDCNGAPVSGISPRVALTQVSTLDGNSTVNETTVSSTPDAGDYMRYDGTAGQWIYNLSSKKTTLVPTGALNLGFYKVTVFDGAGTFTPANGWFQIVK